MAEYLDADWHRLEKGFYVSKISNELLYFIGEYTRNGDPIIEFGPKSTDGFQGGSGEVLKKINEEDIKKRINELKENVGWLEEKLKE